jgi:hypothetical protein
MNHSFNHSKGSLPQSHRAITPEQLNQILEAIVDGKYSWACILMLRSVGYNPLNYIPYRTYARMMKENNANQIHDLGCLEPLEGEPNRDRISQVRGGNRAQFCWTTWLNRWL